MEAKMNRKVYLSYFVMIVVVLAMLISSCNFSKIKIGEVRMMYGDNQDGHIAYTFSTFTGFERGRALVEQGQAISFNYQASVERGSLDIEWQTPGGEVLWRRNVTEGVQGVEVFQVETPGEYTVIIQGKDADGDFDVSWQVK
jgi:hypothetical protein